MNSELYLNTLTQFCEYIIGTPTMVSAKGKGYKSDKGINADRNPPEAGGFPVMLSLKKTTTTCDWCQQEVSIPNTKVYSRPIESSPLWQGKCETCGKREIKTPTVK